VSELVGIARFKFHEGKLDEYKRSSSQAMEIVRAKDTGTLVGTAEQGALAIAALVAAEGTGFLVCARSVITLSTAQTNTDLP
jgi:hypothetical protein